MPKSDSAPGKPHDSATTRFNRGIVIVAAIAVVGAVAWVTLDPAGNNAGAEAGTPKLSVDSSPERQRARKEFIDRLITSGVIHKIDKPVKLPHVYVSGPWHRLSADQKQTAMRVVLAYYYVKDPRAHMLVIRDAVTRKRIGTFSESGLEFD